MIEIRPSCENCNNPLPANSVDARICSFECTFCADCAENVLHNVCPNCGGGFCQRPVRPATNRRNGACLENFPASQKLVHKPVSQEEHDKFNQTIKLIPPEQR